MRGWRPRRRLAFPGAVAAALLVGGAFGAGSDAEALNLSLDPDHWEAAPAAGVALELAAAAGPARRPALRLEWDFQGRAGWAAARHRLDLELPASYELRFALRGAGPANHLEVKLVDPSGENVWWHVRRDLEWSEEWEPVRVRRRQLTFAWGPAGGGELVRMGALELTVTAGAGGRGWVEIADLELVEVPPPAAPTGPPRAAADAALPGHPAAHAVDGDPATAWRPPAAGGELTVDLTAVRELGGVSLDWQEEAAAVGTAGGRAVGGEGRAGVPARFRLELSLDGERWEASREVVGSGLSSHLMLPEAEARFLRLRLGREACPRGCSLAELRVRPLDFGASPTAMVTALAAEAPRGAYPRGFSGEAVYWTVVGLDGDHQEGLFSEDGALELGERGLSLEPFLFLDDGPRTDGPSSAPASEAGGGRLWSWAEVAAEQTLAEGDLPLPTVSWPLPGARLEVTALATGEPGRSALLARYRVTNLSAEPLRGRLLLAARPLQVNPPYQFLNVAGGVAQIAAIACAVETLQVDGAPRVTVAPAPAACGAAPFDHGPLHELVAAGSVPAEQAARDPVGLAVAVLAWELELPPGADLEVVAGAPLQPAAEPLAAGLVASGAAGFAAALERERRRWRALLDGVTFDLPPEAEPLVRTLRSSLAWILIHRDGAALQPGSRAYARSWIRDGALTGAALLRLGHFEPVRDFTRWFASFQYPDGAVPCCVDRRGADPVPEHDSHGQLVHLIAETFRYTRDRSFAEELFPHVERAVEHLEALRQSRRTEKYRQPDRLELFGLLPESISHEGYATRPVHSYWDMTFAYRGLDDAAALAAALGRHELAARWGERRDELREELFASIARVRQRHGIPYLPGSADLADFDSTATTVALDPGGLGPYLPADALAATFERFYQEQAARRARAAWDAYTPYEVRHVGAFVRLGWRQRAHELLAAYLEDLRPPAWNGWPEVVTRDAREPRFLGDLPHGWVASDFVRSLLDLFAFENREREALVLAAGVPPEWLERAEGIAIAGLATPWGTLDYALALRPGGGVRYTVSGALRPPPGGVVLRWPLPGRPAGALIEGAAVPLEADGSVVLRRLPATVDLLAEGPEHERGSP